MSVRVEADLVRLEGDCPAADAERLCAALSGPTPRVVDVSGALTVHGAVVQALLALAPEVRGAFSDPFLRAHVGARLTRPQAGPPMDTRFMP